MLLLDECLLVYRFHHLLIYYFSNPPLSPAAYAHQVAHQGQSPQGQSQGQSRSSAAYAHQFAHQSNLLINHV
jgi:hypothetical protein